MLLTAQTTTTRTVLLEQFTGTWCQYCPYGADMVDTVLSQFPNTVALAYHNGDPMSTAAGDGVIAHLLVSSYPSGAVDRRLWNTPNGLALALSRGYWQSAVNNRAAIGSPLSIGVAGTYHQDTRQITATVTLNTLTALTGEFYLNIVLSEDNLDYAQKKNINDVLYTISPYYHKRVVRNIIPAWQGTQLTTTGLTLNQVVTHPFTFSVPAAYDVSELKLTVFVTQKVVLTVNSQPQNKSMNVEQAWQQQLTTALTVIPVELISFNATQIDDGVRLNWRTGTESNNRGWYIQRRTQSSKWNDIGFVDGYGTTNDQQVYEFVDGQIALNETYDYRLRQVDFDGSEELSDVFRINTMAAPMTTRLLPNFPNPFNPSTSIVAELAQDGVMSVEIYDMLGRLIRTLADGHHAAGAHVFEWDGLDESGTAVQSGIYFSRLSTADYTQTIQMQMTK
jgi:hypothetical protein